MAQGMSQWAQKNFQVQTKEDLDDYTYYVAGVVSIFLSKLWDWSFGHNADYDLAVGFGHGLQAVNILRNQDEDMDERGVSFRADGWTRDDLFDYAETNLSKVDAYIETLTEKSTLLFCRLPLEFAHKSLNTMKKGQEKMSRQEVEQTVEEVKAEVEKA